MYRSPTFPNGAGVLPYSEKQMYNPSTDSSNTTYLTVLNDKRPGSSTKPAQTEARQGHGLE